MEIKCTPREVKELLQKEEQTECKSECSIEDIKKKITTTLSDEFQNFAQASCDTHEEP